MWVFNLKKGLKKHNLSPWKASQILQVPHQFIYRACNQGNITMRSFLQIVNTLGIPPVEFFEKVEEIGKNN